MKLLTILITGFLQHRGRLSGLMRCREELISNSFAAGPERRVWLEPWNANWERIAKHIEILRDHYREPLKILVAGYSWGGGWGAVRLAEELNALTIPQRIRAMVLVDPVFRHPNPLLRWQSLLRRDYGSLTAFLNGPVIRYPSNVVEIWQFNQTQSRPMGHRVTADAALIHPSETLAVSHVKIDDHPRVCKTIRSVAEMLKDEIAAGDDTGV